MQGSSPRVIVVTGANRGIGFSLMRRLVNSATDFHTILTCRSENSGKESVAKLLAEQPSKENYVHYHVLDITNTDSVEAFALWLKDSFGRVDVLVNNAAIFIQDEKKSEYEPSLEDVKTVINTNYFATRALTEKILPLLTNDGKILTVSSTLGVWETQGKTLNEIFVNPEFDEKGIEEAISIYEKAAAKKSIKSENLSHGPYRLSKALVNAWVRYLLPKQLGANQQSYTICPGWCRTDMGGEDATKSVDEGSDTIEYLINLPFKYDKELNGKFITERKVRSF